MVPVLRNNTGLGVLSDLFTDRWFEPFNRSMKFPAVDIEETEKAFLIKADLPGLKKEDIKITIEDNQLTISGERSKTEKSETEHYKHFERLQGSFSRSFLLPDSINEENVSAKYENGVLMLTVKKVPSRDATEIKIE